MTGSWEPPAPPPLPPPPQHSTKPPCRVAARPVAFSDEWNGLAFWLLLLLPAHHPLLQDLRRCMPAHRPSPSGEGRAGGAPCVDFSLHVFSITFHPCPPTALLLLSAAVARLARRALPPASRAGFALLPLLSPLLSCAMLTALHRRDFWVHPPAFCKFEPGGGGQIRHGLRPHSRTSAVAAPGGRRADWPTWCVPSAIACLREHISSARPALPTDRGLAGKKTGANSASAQHPLHSLLAALPPAA